ncbi:MAG: response regulator [Deltaproteobacteria bacterium]|nr:response regulator [Deltaproteobacteria bacterium]
MASSEIRVLLVEDDEDDYVLARDILADIPNQSFHIEWAPTVEEALEQARNGGYDLCLLDYRLGHRNGIEVLDELKALGFTAPILMLTGHGDRRVDLEAMRRGAADYLEKDRLSPELMERSVRYALERARTLEALRASEQRLRALSTKLLQAQEEERRRIAKELHDGIGANLTAVKYALETRVAQQEMAGKTDNAGIPLTQIIAAIKETMEETQRISTNLRPSILDNMGLLAALDWTARKTREFYGSMEVQTAWDLPEDEIPDSLKIVLFRLVQESLNNAVKHSGADRISVSLCKTERELEMSVQDNGRGFGSKHRGPEENEGRGMGLDGMMERVELSGGRIDIRSNPGQGTTITASWPVDS